MRKSILTFLLATSVAMPAIAQDSSDWRRDRGSENASSEQRSEARAARQAARAAARAERPERAERQRDQTIDRADLNARREARQQAMQQQGEQQAARQRDQGGDRIDMNARREARRQARQQQADQQVDRQQVAQQQDGERRSWGQRRLNDDGGLRQQTFEQQREYRREGRSRDGSLLGRALEQSYARGGQIVVRGDNVSRDRPRYSGSNRQWSGHWRNDRNYNWRNYRDRNRSIFRRGYYRDPYGYNYRRFSIGFNLFPSYYQSHYWLNDPWQYRLPPAYGPYRWVRYYDDALLVNIYSGQVVDVIHSFFW